MKEKKRPVLGLTETVIVFGAKLKKREVVARIDTGAEKSSIDKSLAEELKLGPPIKTKVIRSSHGKTKRPYIETKIKILKKKIKAGFTVANRKNMKYQILIGQNILKEMNALVDPVGVIRDPSKRKFKAALISQGSISSKMIFAAMQNYFTKVDEIDLKEIEVNLCHKTPYIMHKKKKIQNYDCLYVKGSFRYVPILRSIASFIEEKAYTPIEPQSFSIGHDKFLTHLALLRKKIAMPSTYIASSSSSTKERLKKMKFPLVIKLPTGTQGKGVTFVDSYSSALSILDTLDALKVPFIIQNYVHCAGKDIRCFVVGNRVVAAMQRTAKKGDKRSNTHAGGTGRRFKINKKIEKVAVDAAKAIKADICGVDIIIDKGEPLVLEVNLSPGLQAITAATDIDIADEIARYLFEKTAEFLKKKRKKTI